MTDELTSSQSPIGLVLAAAHFAADRHRDQRRKGVEAAPYINHPLAVAQLLSEAGVKDAEVLAAALLHDTVEDTASRPEELVAHFGARVASIVAEVTDDKALPKAERKRRQIASAPDKSEEAKLVKLADKIANLRDLSRCPPDWSESRISAYYEFALAVGAGLRGINAELETHFDRLLATGLTSSEGKQEPGQSVKQGKPADV